MAAQQLPACYVLLHLHQPRLAGHGQEKCPRQLGGAAQLLPAFIYFAIFTSAKARRARRWVAVQYVRLEIAFDYHCGRVCDALRSNMYGRKSRLMCIAVAFAMHCGPICAVGNCV